MSSSTLRRTAASFVLLAAAATVAAAPPGAQAAPAPVDVTVTVNARAGLATVPGTALGVNHAVWDSQLGTDEVADLLGDAGVRMMRYPGGSYADIYHWETHTAPGGYVAPNTDFDTFMHGVRRAGGEPMIIANYGTGSAEEAAGWVRYANVTKDYDVTYWTVGNENYGNGHYGSEWEADDHADKSPAQYAREVVDYSAAMKAVDPSVKIGAVLTMPGNWPDGIVGTGDQGTWNQTVLERAGPSIDFVDVHWYPGGSTAAEALSRTEHVDDALRLLKSQIQAYGGTDADRIGVSMTETNVGVGLNTQPGALFLADAYTELLEQGVFTVQWWNVHNGIGTPSTVAGQPDFNDFGLLSSGTCTADNSVCEPPLNTPFAPYHALKLLGAFARPGDQLVQAGSSDPLVAAHAVRRANGDLAVLLLNKDPENERAVTLNYPGYTPSSATPAVSTYDNGDDAVETGTAGSAVAQVLSPYGLKLILLHQAGGRPVPAAPGQPVASAVTDRSATISWPVPTGRIDKYEVYRQNGAIGELLGETSGRSLTVRNLEPGRRYTVNVVARDAAGNLSWSSPPLSFTTGTPARSSCTVRFADTTDWGNGFVGSIDVVNDGAGAVSGWTLAFTWPTGWQSVSNGWGADWAQSGRTVRVTSTGTLTGNGGSTTVGFVGNYSGPNVLPAVFTLNGTVCHTG